MRTADENAERAVLAALFHGHVEDAAAVVDARAFYWPAHQAVFRAAADLAKGKQPVDAQTIASALDRAGTLAKFGGIEWVAGLRAASPDVENVKAHAKIVASLYAQRRVVEVAMSIVTDGLAGRDDPGAFVDRSLQRINAAVERTRDTRIVQMTDVVRARVAEWQRMREHGYVGGLKTGIRGLDQKTDGLAIGGLTMLAAATGAGKSVAGWTIANNIADARTPGGGSQPVVYVSGEMDANELHDRGVCARAKVSLRKLRRVCMGAADEPEDAPLSRDDREIIERNVQIAQQELDQAPIFLYPRVADIQDIRGALRDANRTLVENAADPRNPAKVKLLVVDYLQMMRLAKSERHDLALGTFANELKEIAAENKLAVVALAQINQGAKKRDGGAFANEDLKHSTGMSDAAHTVAFLDRPVLGMGKSSEEEKKKWAHYAEIHITKGRSHAHGRIQIFFDGARFTMRDAKPYEFQGLFQDDDSSRPAPGKRRGYNG